MPVRRFCHRSRQRGHRQLGVPSGCRARSGWIIGSDDKPPRSPYAGYSFPAEIVGHAVWLYFRFPLGLRMVEDMGPPAELPLAAAQLRRREPRGHALGRTPTAQRANNRAENSLQSTRGRERQRKRFKSPGQAQRFLPAHDRIDNLFHLRRGHCSATDYRAARTQSTISTVTVQNVGDGANVGIYWDVGTAATLNGPRFAGNVLAQTLIGSDGDLTVDCGRLLSATSQVTLIMDTISIGCAISEYHASGGFSEGVGGSTSQGGSIPEPGSLTFIAGLFGIGTIRRYKQARTRSTGDA
jgi:hypothetical protein